MSPRYPDSSSSDASDLEAAFDESDSAEAFRLRKLPRRVRLKGCNLSQSSFHQEIHDGSAEEGHRSRRGAPSKPRKSNNLFHYTVDEERRVIKKLDRRVVLFMAFLYMLSFLDRSNIGNAKIAGLENDLRISPLQYEWCLSAFYITYMGFEWMTLLYRVIPAHVYISLCVGFWGSIASLQAVTTSFVPLLVLRALLGISEAAFSPGVPFLLSFFYRRDELAFRTGLVVSFAPLATSFAGSLAYAITRLGAQGPIAPWRLLFLVEGFPSVLVAVVAWRHVADSPATADFLTPRERQVAVLRLRKEKQVKDTVNRRPGIDWRDVGQTLIDPQCYLTALMFFSCNVAFSSLPVFLPTIIRDMGYSSLSSQALSAPPYLIAFIVILISASLSDRYRNRGFFVCFFACVGTLGYSLIAVAGVKGWGVGWRYTGVYLACIGFFSAVTIIITWTINNQISDSSKGTGLAMLNLIGQCGPLLGTKLYPARDGPLYTFGMSVCAGFMLAVALLSFALRAVLIRKNKKEKMKYSEVQDDDDDGDDDQDEWERKGSSSEKSEFEYIL